MNQGADSVLQAIVRSAVDGTGASQGWMLRVDAATLRVAAAAGADAPRLLGVDIPAGRGTAGFVIESGEPLALASRSGDRRLQEGLVELLGQSPTSVLTVPCATEEDIFGALELVDKVSASSFSFDDAELVTLLASVAGAYLAHGAVQTPPVPGPAQMAADLERLADTDPARYAVVAAALSAWLSHA